MSRYAIGVSGNRRAVAIRIGTAMKIGNTSSHQVVRSAGLMPEMMSAMAPRRTSATASDRIISPCQEIVRQADAGWAHNVIPTLDHHKHDKTGCIPSAVQLTAHTDSVILRPP